jgi:hypothetical protein
MTAQMDSHWLTVAIVIAGCIMVVVVLSAPEKPAQSKANDDSYFDSYWPTTIRVDTDMDSFWLVNEERVCQTFPGDKGKIAVVSCNATGSHRDHNIPVRFWGSVDRNTVSSWKCRRETDEFVCRAIN